MKRETIVLLVFIALFAGANIYAVSSHLTFKYMVWNDLGIIVAAGLTLAMYSFLYKDNPVFKFTEHLYVGVATGYTVCINWYQGLEPKLFDRLEYLFHPRYVLVVPTLLGLFMFSRLFPKIGWLSRWSFAFITGMYAGIGIPLVISQFILEQMRGTLKVPEFTLSSVWLFVDGIAPLLVMVGVLSVLIYFYFSMEHKGAVGVLSRFGIWFLMISFGASFGFTVMGRVSLLIERLTFLFKDWLNVL